MIRHIAMLKRKADPRKDCLRAALRDPVRGRCPGQKPASFRIRVATGRGGGVTVWMRNAAHKFKRSFQQKLSGGRFFYFFLCNPLKSPDSTKEIQGNARIFPCFYLLS
jgi:hypothetical protein